MTAPTPPRPDESQAPAAPSLAETASLPERNRLVVAKLVGAKEHSGCEWSREGWEMMTWWGDHWNARRMADARETLDADYLDVEAWFYPDEIFTLRAELSRLTGALAAETEARERAEAELKQLSEMHVAVLAVRQETIDALAEREGEVAKLREAIQKVIAGREVRDPQCPETTIVVSLDGDDIERILEAALAPDAEKGGSRDGV